MRAQLLSVDQAAAMNSGKVFKPSRPGRPVCQACGGDMKKKTVTKGSMAVQIFGVLVFLFGIGLTIFVPIIGWVFGPLLMLMALFMGSKRQKVWRCRSCRTIVPRA